MRAALVIGAALPWLVHSSAVPPAVALDARLASLDGGNGVEVESFIKDWKADRAARDQFLSKRQDVCPSGCNGRQCCSSGPRGAFCCDADQSCGVEDGSCVDPTVTITLTLISTTTERVTFTPHYVYVTQGETLELHRTAVTVTTLEPAITYTDYSYENIIVPGSTTTFWPMGKRSAAPEQQQSPPVPTAAAVPQSQITAFNIRPAPSLDALAHALEARGLPIERRATVTVTVTLLQVFTTTFTEGLSGTITRTRASWVTSTSTSTYTYWGWSTTILDSTTVTSFFAEATVTGRPGQITSRLEGGRIVALVIGIILFIVLVAGAVYCIQRRKTKKPSSAEGNNVRLVWVGSQRPSTNKLSSRVVAANVGSTGAAASSSTTTTAQPPPPPPPPPPAVTPGDEVDDAPPPYRA